MQPVPDTPSPEFLLRQSLLREQNQRFYLQMANRNLKQSAEVALKKTEKLQAKLADIATEQSIKELGPRKTMKKLKKLKKRLGKLQVVLELIIHPEHAGP